MSDVVDSAADAAARTLRLHPGTAAALRTAWPVAKRDNVLLPAQDFASDLIEEAWRHARGRAAELVLAVPCDRSMNDAAALTCDTAALGKRVRLVRQEKGPPTRGTRRLGVTRMTISRA